MINTIMRYREVIREGWELVPITRPFVRQVRATAKRIAWDIAEDLPKDNAELAEVVQILLRRINAVGGINPVMLVSRAELRPAEDIPDGITSAGCHYCWDTNSAQVYHHENADDDRNVRDTMLTVSLDVEVPLNNIDWVFTIATNLILPGEREITIKPGSTVTLAAVWTPDGEEIVCNRPIVITGDYAP